LISVHLQITFEKHSILHPLDKEGLLNKTFAYKIYLQITYITLTINYYANLV